MNKFLKSFFFGYLTDKKRRLLRALLFTIVIFSLFSSLTIYFKKFGTHSNNLEESFYEKYQSHYLDLFVTPNGTEVNEIYLIKRYGVTKFNEYVSTGQIKEKSCNRLTTQQYTNYLLTDDNLRFNAIYIAQAEGFIPEDFDFSQYTQDYFINNSTIHDDAFIFAIILTFINLGICLIICLVSYTLEPFIIERSKKAIDLRVIKNNLKTFEEPQAIKRKIVIENEVVKASESVDNKNEHKNNSKFANYLAFNDEYLSGTKFWLRMLVGWITLAILGLGIYIMLTTTYKRAQSLGFGKPLSIIACIYIPIINILTFMLLRTEYSEVNLLKSILVSIPFAYFYLKNGKRK